MNSLARKILMTLVLLLGLSSKLYAAQQATNTFLVSATILPSCVVTASTLGFGNYSPSGSSDIDNTSTIYVYCTSGTAYTLKLNVGTGGGNYTTRTLVSALSQTLDYNLYTTGARSTVWGDGTSGTGTVTGSGSGLLTASQKTVYGRLFQGQDKPPSLYDSVITVTVEY
jgi:spore coat protein U-like protein